MNEYRGPYGGQSEEGRSFFARLTPIVKVLLLLNISIYFADVFFFGNLLREKFAFRMGEGVNRLQLYQILSFQFVHGNLGHLLFNSIGLAVFGPLMERWWNSQARFLGFYLSCGIGGVLFFALLMKLGRLPYAGMQVSLVGASAGIYGILAAVAWIAPDLRVTLYFPPITLTIRQLALGVLAFSVLAITMNFGGNEGGEAGHLGGAIVGFAAVYLWNRYADGDARRNLSGFGEAGNHGRPRSRDIQPKIKPRTQYDLGEVEEIDEILDKISAHGFQSLTSPEREKLDEAGRKAQKSK